MSRRNAFHPSNRATATRLRVATRQTQQVVSEKRAHGRSLQDFLPLRPAEKQLLQACQKGEIARIGEERPNATEGASLERQVRASFLRFLLLGGDAEAPIHEGGVSLHGACIVDQLDLCGCEIPNNIRLKHCLFQKALLAQGTRVHGSFTLEGSALTDGLNADRLQCTGSVFLRLGFQATGQVWLIGAQIEGDLDCSSGQFDGKGRYALLADGVVVKGSVFLDDGFKVTGQVRLLGAQIGGDLGCINWQFDGKDDYALSLGSAEVGGVFFLKNMCNPLRINVRHAQVGVLVDEVSAWAENSTLDGFRYGSLGDTSTTRASDRLEWLRSQTAAALGESGDGRNFRPQPWKQLQRVLRDMGHAEEARQIGIAFEEQQRKVGKIGSTSPTTWPVIAWGKRRVAHALHWSFGFLAGYGYRPMRLLVAMVMVWLVCGALFWGLALPPHSAIGPSDPLVFQNTAYRHCVPDSDEARAAKAQGQAQAGNWFLCDKLPAEYATFSPFAYSLDIILPLVNLGQENAWGALVPTPKTAWWQELPTFSAAHIARWLIWFETLFGWVASLLLVGIVSGFARRTEE